MYAAIRDVYEMQDGDVYAIDPLIWAEDLDAAVEKGQPIHALNEDNTLGEELFDGETWVGERPDLPRGDVTAEVTTVSYVDQRIDLLQAEVEALTNALLDVDPENETAMAVKSLAPDARIAIAFDKESDMDEVIGALRGVPVEEA